MFNSYQCRAANHRVLSKAESRKKPAFFGILITVLLLSNLSLSGCGYRLIGSGTVLPPDVKKVAILPVDNQTAETGLSNELTEAIRSNFERFGVIEVVDDPKEADAVLRTKVVKLETRVRSVTGQSDVAVDYDLVMTLSGELKKRNGQILWRNNNLRASESFASTSGVVVTSSSDFASGGVSSGTLGTLDSREVARGQQREALTTVIDEISRLLYLDAVAPGF